MEHPLVLFTRSIIFEDLFTNLALDLSVIVNISNVSVDIHYALATCVAPVVLA